MTNCLGKKYQVFCAWMREEISEMQMERLCETCIITDNLQGNNDEY